MVACINEIKFHIFRNFVVVCLFVCLYIIFLYIICFNWQTRKEIIFETLGDYLFWRFHFSHIFFCSSFTLIKSLIFALKKKSAIKFNLKQDRKKKFFFEKI
jgi:hypothetical protein